MTIPVSSNQIQQPVHAGQPIGAYSLNGSKELKAGHYVLNPPVIRPYSFYNEITGNPNFFQELVNPNFNKPVRKNKSTGIIKAAAFAGGIVLAFTYRKNIQKFLLDTFNKIKNMIKK